MIQRKVNGSEQEEKEGATKEKSETTGSRNEFVLKKRWSVVSVDSKPRTNTTSTTENESESNSKITGLICWWAMQELLVLALARVFVAEMLTENQQQRAGSRI